MAKEKKFISQRTKLLLFIAGILATAAICIYIYAAATGAFQSSAAGIPIGGTPIAGRILGEVHSGSTSGPVVSGASITATASVSTAPGNTKGTASSDSSGKFTVSNMRNGQYTVTVTKGTDTWKKSGINCVFYEITVNVPIIGSTTKAYDKCDLGKIVLGTTPTEPTGGKFTGNLYVTVNGIRSMACMNYMAAPTPPRTPFPPGTVGCTVTLTLSPAGSHPEPWTNVYRKSPSGSGPVPVTQTLNPGTYKVTGGSLYAVSSNKNYGLAKVNGQALPYTFTMGSGDLSVNLDYQ